MYDGPKNYLDDPGSQYVDDQHCDHCSCNRYQNNEQTVLLAISKWLSEYQQHRGNGPHCRSHYEDGCE